MYYFHHNFPIPQKFKTLRITQSKHHLPSDTFRHRSLRFTWDYPSGQSTIPSARRPG